MDDYDNRFAPGYGTEFTRSLEQSHDLRDLPGLALQDVSVPEKPSHLAIRSGPPIADYQHRKKRRPSEFEGELDAELDEGDDLVTMIVKGHA
jgi:hypothetical protein